MEITAQLKNLRIAPRKVRLLAGMVKGMGVASVRSQLRYIPKRSAQPIAKLLDSAVANAKHNFSIAEENLFVKSIIINEGRKLKRSRPKGFGSASPIQKKTSHILIVLDQKS